MDQIIEIIVQVDLINYANYFLAGFIGSAAGMLKGVSDGETPKKEIISHLIYNGIMGGFAGMLMTAYSDMISFNYAVSGIAGGVGIEKALEIVNVFKGLKISIKDDKNDK